MCSFTFPTFPLSKYGIDQTNCLKFPLTLALRCPPSSIQRICLLRWFHDFTNPDLVSEIPTWWNFHDFDSSLGSGPIKKDFDKDLHYAHQIMIIAFSSLAALDTVQKNDNFQCN